MGVTGDGPVVAVLVGGNANRGVDDGGTSGPVGATAGDDGAGTRGGVGGPGANTSGGIIIAWVAWAVAGTSPEKARSNAAANPPQDWKRSAGGLRSARATISSTPAGN